MTNSNIIFMGTPEFSVPALYALNKKKYNISLVVTQPDRPKGRGKKILFSPVKEVALKLGYNFYQPESINTKESIKKLTALNPDFFVVAAYGHILPLKILSIPKICPINIHASILPKYRGAAPINRAIINGEKETGITTMFMDNGIDTGDILLKSKTKINDNDTTASLHDKLSLMGAELIVKTLEKFDDGSLKRFRQDHAKSSYAPLLKKKDGRINWNNTSEEIDCFIRGMNPWPGAFTYLNDKRLMIFKAIPVSYKTDVIPGTVIINNKLNELHITTGNGHLSIIDIQGASGKKLNISNFLRGTKIEPGSILK